MAETQVFLQNSMCQIHFSIEAEQGPRFRRQIAIEIVKRLEPLKERLKLFSSIDPIDVDRVYGSLRLQRQPSLRESSKDREMSGLLLRLKRLELGWSLRDFAEIADVDFAYLSRIERGLVRPREAIQKRLLSLLEID